MQSSRSNSPASKAGKSHEAGALGAYGAIVGAVAGGGLGVFVSHWLFLAVIGACIGWVAGLLIERGRK